MKNALEILREARHEIDTPGHPDYGKVIYTFDAKALDDFLSLYPRKTELQLIMDDIHHWAEVTFPAATTKSKLNHLKKEVQELIDEVEESERGEMALVLSEFADCFILLFNAAAHQGYTAEDLLVAIREKMRINKARKWGKPDENGVVEHIRTGKPILPSSEETLKGNFKPDAE